MTGSIQPKNGKFYMVISTFDEKGKRKQKWIPTGLSVKGNRKAAEAMLKRFLTEHDGQNLNSAGQDLVDYLESWIVTVEPRLKPSTVRSYRQKLNNQILPYFKRTRVTLLDLHIQHLEGFYAYLLKGGLSPTSVHHCHRLLSTALNDAMRFRLILFNPATLAKLPKKQPYEAKFLNYSQMHELAALFKGDILEPVVQFICTYGVRRSEALGLCWDMIDFENNRFTIARSMIQGDGENILQSSTKNSSSYRTMPLTPSTREMLLCLKKRREKYEPLFPENYAKYDLVFVWEDGTPITPNYLTSHFHKAVMQSHLPKIRLHDLRHSVASNLLANGYSYVEVQHWLGHSQPSTTLNFYAHVDGKTRQRVGEQIADILHFDPIE